MLRAEAACPGAAFAAAGAKGFGPLAAKALQGRQAQEPGGAAPVLEGRVRGGVLCQQGPALVQGAPPEAVEGKQGLAAGRARPAGKDAAGPEEGRFLDLGAQGAEGKALAGKGGRSLPEAGRAVDEPALGALGLGPEPGGAGEGLAGILAAHKGIEAGDKPGPPVAPRLGILGQGLGHGVAPALPQPEAGPLERPHAGGCAGIARWPVDALASLTALAGTVAQAPGRQIEQRGELAGGKKAAHGIACSGSPNGGQAAGAPLRRGPGEPELHHALGGVGALGAEQIEIALAVGVHGPRLRKGQQGRRGGVALVEVAEAIEHRAGALLLAGKRGQGKAQGGCHAEVVEAVAVGDALLDEPAAQIPDLPGVAQALRQAPAFLEGPEERLVLILGRCAHDEGV